MVWITHGAVGSAVVLRADSFFPWSLLSWFHHSHHGNERGRLIGRRTVAGNVHFDLQRPLVVSLAEDASARTSKLSYHAEK